MSKQGTVDSLLAGLQYHARRDGTVFRVHAGGRLIGEVVAGEATVRVNVMDLTPEAELVSQAEGIQFTGRSATWSGGIRVTDENISAVKEVLDTIAREAEAEVEVEHTVTSAIAQLDKAAAEGILDETFQGALQQLLNRAVETPKRRKRSRRGSRNRRSSLTV